MGLCHKTFYSEPKPLQHVFTLVMHAKKDSLGGGRVVKDLPCSVQAIKDRHSDVQHNYVRVEALRKTDCVLPILGLRIHVVPCSFKKYFHAITNNLMVVS